MITQIDKLQPITKLFGDEDKYSAENVDGAKSFGSIFQSAIDTVKEADQEKTQLQYQLSVGELDNPAQLMLAISKEQVALDVLIQLRNKALDVYSEITRISL